MGFHYVFVVGHLNHRFWYAVVRYLEEEYTMSSLDVSHTKILTRFITQRQ
jgi:hypothetical protein